MARLFEYQGKGLLKEAGISIPAGEVAATAKEAFEVATRIGKPVVVKAQVWAGGRGKAGAVKVADTPEKAGEAAGAILRMVVKGFPVRQVLVEERLDIERVGFLNEVLATNQPRYSIKKGEFHTPYEFLNRLQNYTVIPICYGKKKYGIIILAGNRKFIRFERKEKEIIDLFKYNLSMYLYNRKLEINEMENERLKTIGHFANSIVHEFKTPISVIKGLASLAKNKLDDPVKLEEYLDNIIKEANRIVDMSQEVSEYADLRERVLEKTTFSVMEILRQEVEKLRSNLELLQIQVIFVGDESWCKEGNRERFGRLIGYI